uniref:Glycosyltransferase 2-like domain-containing protein n=1 Tax=uncultured Bacillota bacterium TaxID=344338 RepID=A0A650ENM2_9FIRM|nr:hypothetical protein Firmicute1046_3390 [uncultured Firmicutes bacterium]
MGGLQVLCAAINQNDFSLAEDMNIQTDAIIANQNGKNQTEEKSFGTFGVKMICTDTRGVGINRNLALMHSDADICLLADDDISYLDGYEDIVKKAFCENPRADMLIFNLYGDEENYIIRKKFRVRHYNYMRFGAVRIAFKSRAVKTRGIFFNTCFGGGCMYQSGEDTLFLRDCLNRGLKIFAVPVYIATLKNERPSTWFKGYDKNFLYDKGALFAAISKKFATLLCLRFLAVKKQILKNAEMSFFKAFSIMKDGMRGYNANV